MKKFAVITFFSFLVIAGCSTRKNSFINRSYHNTTTKYNVLYNGNLALQQGIEELNAKYQDNFWELLPIEPLKIEGDSYVLPGKTKEKNNNLFDIAEQKAVKAIQKHSMNIRGNEHNKQIDDAYLLLGKARYYSQRFVPALEAFDFVLKHYPEGDLSNEIKIWKAKSQIRLQNEEQAIVALKKLLKRKNITKTIQEQAHTALAMAYIALDSTKTASNQLKEAIKSHLNKEQYTRNLFILGQLYLKEQYPDSSQLVFQQIIDYKKSPKKYKIHSYFEQVKNSTDSTDFITLRKHFNNLLNNYLNKPYFDELYYQLAQIDFNERKDTAALKHLNKSIHTPSSKKFQRSLSYEDIGNYYFDKANFVKAGSYYDSVIANVDNPNTKRIRKIKRKRKSLEEVITYENLLKHHDSILNLVKMDEKERATYFTNYVESLKKADALAAILKENAERNNNSGITSPTGGKQNSKSGKWYFYNIQTVNYGKAGFTKVWGNRELQDNWRWSEKSKIKIEGDKEEAIVNDTETIDTSKKYDITYYISKIPKDNSTIQKLKNERGNALYQLGLIYKEQFQEYPLAILKLERFLSEEPKENLILPAKYHLYRIYEKTGNDKLTQIKKEIIRDYPNSRYTQLIQNKNETLLAENETPETLYEKVYCDYEYEKYTNVINACDKAIKLYEDDPIQAKFTLLKAYAQLKIGNKESFIKGLEFVSTNYPKTIESAHAQEVLNIINGVKKEDKSNSSANKEKETKKKTQAKEQKNRVKPLSDEEKRKKVLELMKKKGPPSKPEKEKIKTN